MHYEGLMSLIKAPWDTALGMLFFLVLRSWWSFLSEHIKSDLFRDGDSCCPSESVLDIIGKHIRPQWCESVWFSFWHSLRPPMSHLLGFREVDTLCCHPYIIQMCGVVDFFANAIEESNATVKAKGMWERPTTTENAAPFHSIWVSNPTLSLLKFRQIW